MLCCARQHDPKKGCQDGRCGSACSQDYNRCMCAWRVEGTKHQHFSRMDGVMGVDTATVASSNGVGIDEI